MRFKIKDIDCKNSICITKKDIKQLMKDFEDNEFEEIEYNLESM